MATANLGMKATETFGTSSPVTGTAPTAVDGTDGQPVQDVAAITVTVSAPAGQLLSGAGTLACYVLFASVGRWSRFPYGDFAVSTSGVRDLTFEPANMIGRFKGAFVKWVPTGVTFNGGSGLGVTQQGTPAGAGEKRIYT